MNIIPDWTLVGLQVLPFLTLMAGLHFILFKPMLAYLQERRDATQGARKEAEALQDKAALKLTQWEAAFARAQAEVAEYRARRRAEAQAVYQKRIAEARAEAETRLADAVEVIQGEAALAREDLVKIARILSQDMATRALGRSLAAQPEA